jgi:ribose/xylose/arabinose/galactoside ABC-type transport system permease subunit
LNTWHKLKWPLLALAGALLFNLVFTRNFFHVEIKDGHLYGNLIDIVNRGAPVMLLALGMTLVIATGGVDLSVGAVMAIAGAVAALQVNAGRALPAVYVISLATALAAGLWNGLLIGFLKVPPIVATLVLMVSGRGIAQLLTNGQHIRFNNPAFEFIGRGHLFGLPFAVTLVAVVFTILSIVRAKTAAGLFIEATGDNERASRYAGVQTRVVQFVAYAVCALCAGFAGLIVTTNVQEADPSNAGMGLELDAILATVIGGTALTGGRFYLGGSLIGAILLQTITTTILARNVPPNWTLVVKAAVIIVVCLLQSENFRSAIFRRRVVT